MISTNLPKRRAWVGPFQDYDHSLKKEYTVTVATNLSLASIFSRETMETFRDYDDIVTRKHYHTLISPNIIGSVMLGSVIYSIMV